MTVVNLSKEKNFYIDNTLHEQLKKVKKKVGKKDWDRVIIVDGGERVGKSVFAMQIGAMLDPTLSIERICFNDEQFKKAILNAKKGQTVIYDEAFTGLSSRKAMSEVNKILVEMMMEMGQRNLFVIIVMPTFFLLDKYVALWRATDLFHVYLNNGRRGFWMFFNKKKKKLLYLFGKKEYTYQGKRIPKSGFLGRFYDQYTVDEQEYRKKKRKSLVEKVRTTKQQKFMEQRNKLLKGLFEDFMEKDTVKLSHWCKKKNYEISRNRISEIVNSKKY